MPSSLLPICITFVVISQLSSSYTKTCGFYGCDETTINCPPNEDCNINCSGLHSCESSTINCPSNYQCTIDCSNTAACYDLTVYAQQSSKLQLTDCKSGAFDYTCSDMSIFCPPNINGVKKCIIPGDNSMGGKHEPYMQFYAINGWNDIDFSGYSGSSNGRKGTMHCTHDYSYSCAIDSSFSTGFWTCADSNNICMHPPTPRPTNMPTVTPTNIPTHTPTEMPTNVPTNMPSKNPTRIPTHVPTNMPTNMPSNSPTEFPTKFPTKTPTEMPSIFPTIPPSIQPTIFPTTPPITSNSKDITLVISGDFNSDSLEVKDTITTEAIVQQVDEAVNATTEHNNDMLHEYILWIGLGFVFAMCTCIMCIYCCMKHKTKMSTPKIYHIDHYGDSKNIEMQQPQATGVIFDEDGNETVIPPKKGKIKYSPFGAINENIENITNIQSEMVMPRVQIPMSTLPIYSINSISKVSMDVTPNSGSSIKYLDSFILDAKNDDEVLGNDMVVTPQFENAVITPQLDYIPKFDDKNDFDVVINDNINENMNNVIDDDMIIYVNNDVSINGNGIVETKGK